MARGKGLFGWGGPNQEPVCSSPHGTIRPSVNVRHLGQALETYWRNTHDTTKPDVVVVVVGVVVVAIRAAGVPRFIVPRAAPQDVDDRSLQPGDSPA